MLNNEARYLAPLLSYLTRDSPSTHSGGRLGWEEWYMLLLWLSHLMLAPFDLASVAAPNPASTVHDELQLFDGLPAAATVVLKLGLSHAFAPGKEKESAVILLCRLALRTDMQERNLPDKLIKYINRRLRQSDSDLPLTTHEQTGLLSLLYRLLNLGSSIEVTPYLPLVFSLCINLATTNHATQKEIRDAAPCRKLILKIARAAMVHAVYITKSSPDAFAAPQAIVDEMVEEVVQLFLDALSDKDTPVRAAAAKNLALVTMQLDKSMQYEIIEAILDSFNENMLLQEAGTGDYIPATDVSKDQAARHTRDLSAVDPLKWQGLLLTLGHLLFRRSPPADQLSRVLDCLILGLNFEQRSNVGTSVGVSVRDAACFGVWCAARKYSTVELQATTFSKPTLANNWYVNSDEGSLQRIATELVLSACLDPAGNIRRGSSAALQELVGRHPDIVINCIALVQIVDYQAVARRVSAMNQVGIAASRLGEVYYHALLGSLLGWRGSQAADIDSRRFAADTLSELLLTADQATVCATSKHVQQTLELLKVSNTGATAEARHGFLLALAACVNAETQSQSLEQHSGPSPIQGHTRMEDGTKDFAHHSPENHNAIVEDLFSNLSAMTGNIHGRNGRDLELVLEGTAVLLASLFRHRRLLGASKQQSNSATAMDSVLDALHRCLSVSENEHLIDVAAKATAELFRAVPGEFQEALVERLTSAETRTGFRGRTAALSQTFLFFEDSLKGQRFELQSRDFLHYLLRDHQSIEVKIFAMVSIASICMHLSGRRRDNVLSVFVNDVVAGLSDYTVDQRGDIGSKLRLESIHVANIFLSVSPDTIGREEWQRSVVQRLVLISVEKMSKLRFEATLSLREHWSRIQDFPCPPNFAVSHVADVSSVKYYLSVMPLMQVEWLRDDLVLGLASSVAGSTDDIGRSACEAIVSFLQAQTIQIQQLYSRTFYAVVTRHLDAHAKAEDREVSPSLEFLAFLLETRSISFEDGRSMNEGELKIAQVLREVQGSAPSVQRLEAIIKVYSTLCDSERHNSMALDKLTRFLLHRYPKVSPISAFTVQNADCCV